MGRTAGILFFALLCTLTAAACATPQTFDDDSGPAPPADAGMDASACPASTKRCGTACIDTTKDPNNCGACGSKCPNGQYCAGSKCNSACTMPFTLCGQFCVDISKDHDNCGKCGMGCAADQVCVAKACQKNCPLTLTLCDPDCVDLLSDPNHCGDCNTQCGMNEVCTGGSCCPFGQTACNGVCTDTQFDINNCGQCGFACGGNTPWCAQGICKAGCVPNGQRQLFNTVKSKTASGCWQGNPCAQDQYSWTSTNGINFQANAQDIVCSGTTSCVGHVGITTYQGTTVCQGKWDVYCDSNKVGAIDTVGKSCTGSAMSNGCSTALAAPVVCSTVRLVATAGGGQQGCCAGNAPDSMITAISAW